MRGNRSLVVDAAVVAKWLVAEELAAEADRLRPLVGTLATPDFCLVELANVARKKARQETLLPDDARAIAPSLQRSGVRFPPGPLLLESALDLARELDHPVYDCLYVAAVDLLGARASSPGTGNVISPSATQLRAKTARPFPAAPGRRRHLGRRRGR